MNKSGIPQLPSKKSPPKPPKELKAAGRALWNKLQTAYDISDEGGQASLLTVCRCEDDIQAMRAEMAKTGLTTRDRFGHSIQHRPRYRCMVET